MEPNAKDGGKRERLKEGTEKPKAHDQRLRPARPRGTARLRSSSAFSRVNPNVHFGFRAERQCTLKGLNMQRAHITRAQAKPSSIFVEPTRICPPNSSFCPPRRIPVIFLQPDAETNWVTTWAFRKPRIADIRKRLIQKGARL